MKPYSKSVYLSDEQKIYNYRISRARINIECAFGILSKRWAILRNAMAFKVETCQLITTTTLLLHNFIITENLKTSEPTKSYSHYPLRRHRRLNGIDDIDDRILSNSDLQRNKLKDYFSTPEGSVSWQRIYALRRFYK